MKRLLVLCLLALTNLAGWTQGTVRFDNNIPGVVVTHAYVNSSTVPGDRQGNGPDDYPPGATDYSDSLLLAGPNWHAQLWGAPGADRTPPELKPAWPATTFQIGENAGFFVPLVAAFTNIPPDAAVATLQVRVWQTRDYFITISGESLTFNVDLIGGQVNEPAVLSNMRSFSIAVPEIPEPSAVPMLCLGAAALLMRHRSRSPGGRRGWNSLWRASSPVRSPRSRKAR
jgi:hypothetical protein